MIYDLRGAAVSEKKRRRELASALRHVLSYSFGDTLATGSLRRHLSMFYGKDLAYGAFYPELCAGVAIAGGSVPATNRAFMDVALKTPGKRELRRIYSRWTDGLPPIVGAPIGGDRRGDLSFADLAGAPAGTQYVGHDGRHRQVPPDSAVTQWRTGGDGNGGTKWRRRRFAEYAEAIAVYLSSDAGIPAVDRQILELVVEGLAVRSIAKEVRMSKSVVHRCIARHRALGGITGPGCGKC